MRITSWNCLCRDVSRRLSDLAPLRSDLITLQECRRALGVPVFGGVGPPVAACATIAGRFVQRVQLGREHRMPPCGLCASRGAQAGGVRPLPPPATRRCRGPCALTRCRVVRGGGVMRCAGRRVRPGEAAAGLAPPAPAAPDTRRVGLRRRAVPAH